MINSTGRKLTVKEYYEHLVSSAIDGTFPSYNKKVCMYHMLDGDKQKACAVGIAIPWGNKDIFNNTATFDEFVDKNPEVREFFPVEDFYLKEIQGCHDKLAENWNSYLFIKEIS